MTYYGYQHHPSSQEESPTQDEIKARCAEVQATWSPAETLRRAGIPVDHKTGKRLFNATPVPTIRTPRLNGSHYVPAETPTQSKGGQPRMKTATKAKFKSALSYVPKRDRILRDIASRLRDRFPDASSVRDVIDSIAKLCEESDECHFMFAQLRDLS